MIELFNFADNLIENNITPENSKKVISKEEAVKIAKNYSDAIISDPAGMELWMLQKYQHWLEETKVNNDTPKSPKPGYKRYLLETIMANNFGQYFSDVVSTPYILRINILNKWTELYKTKDVDQIITKIIIRAKIEDKLKGSSGINTGDTLDIFYFTFWLDRKDEFEVAQSFAIPVNLQACTLEGCQAYALKIYKSEDKGIYKIDNNKIIAWEGNEIDWQIYKADFIKTYIDF